MKFGLVLSSMDVIMFSFFTKQTFSVAELSCASQCEFYCRVTRFSHNDFRFVVFVGTCIICDYDVGILYMCMPCAIFALRKDRKRSFHNYQIVRRNIIIHLCKISQSLIAHIWVFSCTHHSVGGCPQSGLLTKNTLFNAHYN